MPRVSPPEADQDAAAPAQVVEPVPETPTEAQRPMPPNPGIGGSYLLDPVEWVWVLQSES